jgi:two-component system C4-dicarboxylate transport sensor histidine kinase DctB
MVEGKTPGRLRWALAALGILFALSLFVVLFGAVSRRDFIAAARQQAERRAALEAGTLIADVGKFRVLPFVLVELPDVKGALDGQDRGAIDRLDRTLSALAAQTGATVFYAVDRLGIARSASNATKADSFVGYDFRFRPYFIESIRRGRSEYFARGSVTGRPGLFLARRAGSAARPLGVIVVKIEFQRLEQLWRSAAQNAFVVDRDGVIIIATDPERRFRLIGDMPPDRRSALEQSGQYSGSALQSSGLTFEQDGFARDERGRQYLVVEQSLPILGWRHFHLEPLRPVIAAADARTRIAAFILAIVLISVVALASLSGARRRRIEANRLHLEAEVARRTSELTAAYDQLQNESDERMRADMRYRAAREELAQANRLGSIGTITTSVAHELNQPLAAIRTASDNALKLLVRGNVAQASDNLSLIIRLTERIATITGELLSFGRRGRGDVTLVPIDDIIDGAMLLIADSYRRGKVRLDVARAQPLPSVRAGRVRIEQVLVNLLQNALEAVRDCADPRVELKAVARAQSLYISIADNGPGVPADLIETIFQPFYTGRPDGTGLGLGISREIMMDHGGALTVESNEWGGATFVVMLPAGERERT